MPSPDAMPAYVGNPLAGDPIWEASSAFELRIAITMKQVSRAAHPSDLLVATSMSADQTVAIESRDALRCSWTRGLHRHPCSEAPPGTERR